MSKRPRRQARQAPVRAAAGPPYPLREALGAAVLVLAIVLAYARALHGQFVWDDDFYVSNNDTLLTIGGLSRIWFEVGSTPQYYPLVFTTFWVEHHLWGGDPLPYHLVNVLLHAANALLVWRIGRRLGIPGAAAAAFLFGLHPVHVESVAWITERKNVLSGFFYLAAMASFLRASPPREDETQPTSWPWYAASLVLFAAALFSKTVTATLPVALLLVHWWKTGRIGSRQLLLVSPMIAAGAVAGWGTTWVEAHHVGTKYIAWNLGAVDRSLIAAHAVWFYLGKLLLPVRLTFIYPRWHLDASALSSYLAPLGALAGISALWALRGRWGRGPLVGALFFVATLAPALGFVDVFPMRFSFVADHFQYLASLGPIVVVAALAARVAPRPESLLPVGVAASIVLGLATYRQSGIYRDRETLWRDTLAKNPRAAIAQVNLGAELQLQKRWEEADRAYRRALDDPECLDRPDVLRNLAVNATQQGDAARAIAFLERAISERPAFPAALTNLGELLRGAGRTAEAVDAFERAVAADPGDAVARNNLGSARFDANRLDESVSEFRQAIALKPDMVEAHFNLGNALSKLQRAADAESEYLTAIRLRPDYAVARINLANLWLQNGRVDDAIGQLEESLRRGGENPLAHYGLGYALSRQGRRDEAAAHYRAAERLRPELKPPPEFQGR